MSASPRGWADVRLGEVADAQLGRMLSKGRETGRHAKPYLRNRDVQWGSINVSNLPMMDFPPPERYRFRLRRGDVLVCEGGEVGRAAIWTDQLEECYYQKALHRVRTGRALTPAFLRYLLEHLALTKKLVQHTTGSTIAHMPQEDLRDLMIPLAPLPEQERIVAAIEEEFSRLDVGLAALDRARRRVAALRSAYLRALEDGPWPQKRLGEVAATRSGGTPSRGRPEYYGGGIPWVKSGELRDARVTETEETLTELGLANSSTTILPAGTLLIAMYGATVGKLAVLDIQATTNQAVCAITPSFEITTPFLRLLLEAKRKQLIALAQGGAQPNISQTILRELPISVPPVEEQERLVDITSRSIQDAIALASHIERQTARIAKLRISVLAAAFSGQLVAGDPADEPADTLVERFKADRSLASNNGARRTLQARIEVPT